MMFYSLRYLGVRGTMPSELEMENKEATQRIWEILESGDLAQLSEVLADDVVLRVPGEDEMRGIDAYREYVQSLSRAFPDVSFEVHDMFLDDDVVITHFTWRATHEGEIEGIEATGETVETEGVTINRFKDGKAVEDINYWDNLEFFQQLGVMEPPSG